MRIIITLEYIINFVVLALYYMHMFQLNSYFFKKHMHWANSNKKKIAIQSLLIIIATVFALFNNIVTQILCILVLGFSCFYNIPKEKSKIPLKFTNRVKRMFITELILAILIFLVCGFNNFVFIKLFVLNILSPILCVIVNVINSPIEILGRKRYINDAKKILKNMPNLTVIGVTGSYGKTSVKNFLVQTLSSKYEVLTTPKNYNTTMGVVKTIRENLKPIHQIFVCEMGATKPGDIKEICDIVNPTIGVITSIGPQHLESFKSIDNVIKTKFELADSVKNNNGIMFLNYDNEYIANHKIDMKTISYGIENSNLDYNAYNLNSTSKGLTFKMQDKNNVEFEFKTQLIGRHNITNLAASIAVANYLGVPFNKLAYLIKEIKSVEHRLQLLPHGDFTIIDDSYNSNPVSSKSAIDTLGEFEGTKIIVTPGLIELGNDEAKYNFELGEYATKVCDYIFIVESKNSKSIEDGAISKGFDTEKIFKVNRPQDAIKQISDMPIHDKITVLLENDLPDNYNV